MKKLINQKEKLEFNNNIIFYSFFISLTLIIIFTTVIISPQEIIFSFLKLFPFLNVEVLSLITGLIILGDVYLVEKFKKNEKEINNIKKLIEFNEQKTKSIDNYKNKIKKEIKIISNENKKIDDNNNFNNYSNTFIDNDCKIKKKTLKR